MIVSISEKFSRHVKVFNTAILILVSHIIKESHYSSMAGRLSSGCILDWWWIVAEVESESVSIITENVAVKPIAFLFIGYTQLASMQPLKPSCLLIHKYSLC